MGPFGIFGSIGGSTAAAVGRGKQSPSHEQTVSVGTDTSTVFVWIVTFFGVMGFMSPIWVVVYFNHPLPPSFTVVLVGFFLMLFMLQVGLYIGFEVGFLGVRIIRWFLADCRLFYH
jgi:hypothetical protein